MVLHFTALGNGSNEISLLVASWKDRHGHFSQLLSAAAATLQQQQEESIIFNGMELVQKPIAQPQPEMPIFLSTLKGQSFFQTSSSTHGHLFLPQFKCSNANL
ncbi:hypothetical protein BDL97_05G103000 [Sphagnum fallax]|jgi:hypothetical protein|nr:hypothetical protein BDL97_05G103000 [Sphagnum fallax]